MDDYLFINWHLISRFQTVNISYGAMVLASMDRAAVKIIA